MKTLSEYIYCAFLASLAAGVAEQMNVSKKHVKILRLVISLVLLLFLILPLKGLLQELAVLEIPSVSEGEETTPEKNYSAFSAYMTARLEEAIVQDLETSFDVQGIDVKLDFYQENETSFLLTKIVVILPSKEEGKRDRIRSQLESTYGCTVEVHIVA